MLRMILHQRAAELHRILAGRARALLDEALHVDAVLIGVDAAPRPDRHMGVAHRVLDQQVREGVAELRVAGLFAKALELTPVLAADDGGWIVQGVDRLARHANVQSDQVAVGVEASGQPALRDRAVEVVRLILLAAPDQLDRNAGKLLGDDDRLAHVVLRAAAPAEAAAEVIAVDLALVRAAGPTLPTVRRARLPDSELAPKPRPCRPRFSPWSSSAPSWRARGRACCRSPRPFSRRPAIAFSASPSCARRWLPSRSGLP